MSNVREEFQKLYEKYSSYIYKFLIKWTNGDILLSEELAQETFYQVFILLHRYRGECNVKTWICKIAINTACKHYNKNPKYTELSDLQQMESGENPEETVLHREDLNQLRSAVKQLKKKYRDIVIYRIYFELSFAEIARIMNISENSAKVLYHRAKEMLHEKLNAKVEESDKT